MRRSLCIFLACLGIALHAQSSASGLELRAIAPDHVGLTLKKSPVLYYFISEATTFPIRFLLRDPRLTRGVVEVSLPSPARSGYWAIRLKDYGITLAAGVEYRWFVTVIMEQEEIVAEGVIECCPDNMLDAYDGPESCNTTDTVLAYARNGIWYDALACLGELIEADPNNQKLLRLRERLVKDVGLILTQLH